MNILVFTTLWPNAEQPNLGVFIRNRTLALARRPGVNVRVVAPVPYFPRTLAGLAPPEWRKKARIPARETLEGLAVEHPRYLVTPKVGMRYYARWMAQGATRIAGWLHARAPFDLIDAHYLYPDCLAALSLGQALNLPVVMSARGSDVNVFPGLPHIRPLIQQALAGADGMIAVSQGLKNEMLALGAAADRLRVIRNGVNGALFYPREQGAARQRLGLDPQRKILLTVCSLTPRKGVDRLIEALARLRRENENTNAMLCVVGEGPVRPALAELIGRHNLRDHVLLAGAKPNAALADWYAAADLFCFASHGEGCPNVVLEAQACGLPVLGAHVAGVDELLTDADLGMLVPTDNPAQAFATAMRQALARAWDRELIAGKGSGRAWEDVAADNEAFMREVIARRRK
ncbi:MAG: glycosyltransferase [Blastocatellia bacterium]